jgi:histidyl-tRNA synthetase
VRGTHDRRPDAAPGGLWLHETHRRVVSEYGYALVDTPIFEHTELFLRGVGTGTDVVDKEMYTFTDRGDRSLTLRPEGTAPVVRAALGARPALTERPLRMHYAGAMFRQDRPQKGRYRQFFQVGVECLGERSPHLDVEVIEMGVRFLAALGITGVSVQVNSLGDRDDRARYREQLLAYFTPLRDRLCEDCRRRLETNPLRILDCKRDAATVAGAPRLADSLSAESTEYFDTVLEALGEAGISTERNHLLVRGLDYYAHTTFEFWHSSLEGAQNSLAGGGRYDGLAEAIGFPATPGVGYAFGVERLLLVAAESGSIPPAPPQADVVVCSVAAAQHSAAASMARRLRHAGIRTVLDASDRKMGAKLKHAAGLGASVAVILGEAELAAGEAQLKYLHTQTQSTVPISGLVGSVEAAVAQSGGRA